MNFPLVENQMDEGQWKKRSELPAECRDMKQVGLFPVSRTNRKNVQLPLVLTPMRRFQCTCGICRNVVLCGTSELIAKKKFYEEGRRREE